MGDVKRETLRVDDALDKAEILGNELLAVVHDEDATDVQLDVVLLLLVLEKVKRSALGHEQQSLELELSLDGEVFDGKMVFPVVGQALVKVSVFFLGNVVGVTGPDRLRLVQFLVFDVFGLDLFRLLLILLVLVIFVFVILHFLDLGLFLLAFFLLFLLRFFFRLFIFHFFLLLFGHGQLDGITDELRVLLHDLLYFLLFDVLGHVFLKMEDYLGPASKVGRFVDGLDSKGAAGRRFPFVPIIVVVLRLDAHAISHQIGRVKTHAELTDHRNVSAGLQRLHKGLGARLGDGAEIVDEIGFGHADTSVDDGQRLGLRVGDDLDLKVLARVQARRVSEGLIADFVESIGGVGDQLSKENFFVGIEGVDDEGHKLSDLSLESEGFNLFGHLGVCLFFIGCTSSKYRWLTNSKSNYGMNTGISKSLNKLKLLNYKLPPC